MVFFDIDETLVDQRAAELVAARSFLAALGGDVPRELRDLGAFCSRWRSVREQYARAYFEGRLTHRQQRRLRLRAMFGEIGAKLSDAQTDHRFELFQAFYRAAWRPFPDVTRCLDELRDVRLGVISNGNGRQQRGKLEATGLADRFEIITISEDVGAAKPDARIFTAACRAAGVQPANCWHVGDRLDADARAASAAGLRGVWLNRQRQPAAGHHDMICSLHHLPAKLPGTNSPAESSVTG